MINRSLGSSGKLAVICQSLYLANLLLLPGIFFLVLLYFYRQYQHQNINNEVSSGRVENNKITLGYLGIGKIHLIRSIQFSIMAGILLVIIPLIVIYLTSQLETSIMVGLIYFVTLHTGFFLIGMLNLSRAMAKKLPLF